MRINEIANYQHIWYHGSGMDFEHFDTKAKRLNRSTNPEGIFLTKDEDLARLYAQRGKQEMGQSYVYECQLNVTNPFYEERSEVTPEMEEEYVRQLITHTTYKEDWVRKALLPDYIRTRRMKMDLPGEIKTAVMVAGGYDSYFFNDMGDNVIIVFDADDIDVLNKFTPQELVKDPEYDDHIKQPKKTQPSNKTLNTPANNNI